MSKTPKTTVATRLTELAKKNKISQSTISRETKTAKSTVHSWFTGKTLPKTEHFRTLCTLLGCSYSWLLTGEHENDPLNDLENRTYMLIKKFDINKISPEAMPFPSILLDCKNREQADIYWFNVENNGAEPFLKVGDIAFIDRNKTELENQKFFAFQKKNTIFVHQVEISITGVFILNLCNNSCSKIELNSIGEYQVLGQVIGRVGAL